MSSSGILSVNSGPLIIRTYLDGSNNNSYVLGNYDVPVASGSVLITSSNGLLAPSNNITISSISTYQLTTLYISDSVTLPFVQGDQGELAFYNFASTQKIARLTANGTQTFYIESLLPTFATVSTASFLFTGSNSTYPTFGINVTSSLSTNILSLYFNSTLNNGSSYPNQDTLIISQVNLGVDLNNNLYVSSGIVVNGPAIFQAATSSLAADPGVGGWPNYFGKYLFVSSNTAVGLSPITTGVPEGTLLNIYNIMTTDITSTVNVGNLFGQTPYSILPSTSASFVFSALVGGLWVRS